jgi:hypothetical protein
VADSDILRGAELIAASRMLGLSEDETISLIQRKNGQNNRRRGTSTTDSAAAKGLTDRMAQVAAVNADMPADIDDYRSIPNREVEFGEFGNQDELQNFGGRDDQGNIGNVDQQIKELEQAQGRKDPNVIARSWFEKGKEGLQREEMYIPDGMPVPERFVEAAKNRDFGIYQEGVAAPAAQVQRMERERLQQGVDQFGADAFGGVPDPQRGIGVDEKGSIPYEAVTPGAADVIGRIDDDIRGGSGAEQSLAREMVQRDRQRQNSEVVEANNWRAQAAANVIGQDFQTGGRGARADQAMENIGNIAKLGHAKYADDFEVSNNPVDRGNAIPNSLEINLPDQYNAPVTDNRFAGPLQRQEQWLVDAVPGFREQGAFGNYPDVGINEQIGLARQAIQNAKIKGQSVDLGDTQIRGLSDLQGAVDQVLGLAQKRGQPFFNNVDGRNVVNRNPGIGEVLERGGMNARQVGDVAKAMFAVEAARRNPANQGRKEQFAEGVTIRPMVNKINFGGEHPALGGGEAKIAMVNREKVDGREVGSQLRKLDGRVDRDGNPVPRGEELTGSGLAQARMPFQAAVAGEGVGQKRYVRGADRGLSEDAIYEKYGPVNGQIANAVIQRAEQSQGVNPDGFGQRVERQRNMDPGSGFETGPDPWTTPPATGSGISTGATQGPRSPGIRDKIMNSIKRAPTNFAGASTRQRAGAAIGAGLLGATGLSSLISGERDNRQEAQY